MVTAVSQGQVRFTAPGLLPDARGIVAGRELAARFPGLDRLVWFLRLLSAERPPDEVWAGMRVLRARSALGLREVIAVLPNPSSQAADVVARAARTAGGQCFTGTGKHLVQVRDVQAPFGYDATELVRDAADLVLYGRDGTSVHRVESETPLERLLLGLELRRRSPGDDDLAGGDVLFVAARRGLTAPLLAHLVAAGVRGVAAACEPSRASAFGASAGFWLLRLERVPARLRPLLSGTPGLATFVPVLDNVAVAAGWEHPVHLAACRAVLKPDRLLLLAPPPAGVTSLPLPLPFAAIEDVIPVRTPAVTDAPPRALPASAPAPFEVPLRLESRAGHAPRAVAAWIPWREVGWLRRLCYALPATALRAHRVALLEPAVLVLAQDELAGLPFGQPLDEIAPGVLVPVGSRVVPAVAPDRLAERLGVGQGSYLVFPARDARPLRVTAAQLEPLDRLVLAQARLDADRPALARRELSPADDAPPPDVVHDPLGPWPLWGLERR